MGWNKNTSNAYVRKIQIDLIADVPNSIVEWFDELWSRLSIVETNVYHHRGGEIVYYLTHQDEHFNRWVFYQDNADDKLWCSYNRFWRIIERDFPTYDDVQAVTKFLIERAITLAGDDLNVVFPIGIAQRVNSSAELMNVIRKIDIANMPEPTSFETTAVNLSNCLSGL